jgi:hypothetical protein
MTISARNRKILWSRAGNLCAFPGCVEELVRGGGDASVVIGDEAHIIAQAGSGPRAHLDRVEVDSCSNIMLLCPTHHRLIDSQPEVYTVPVLKAMKAQHEATVRAWQRAKNQLETAGVTGYEAICGSLRTVGAWRFRQSVLVACSFGSDPVFTETGRWRGSGLNFRHVHDCLGAENIFFSSEAEPDIEYAPTEFGFIIIQSSYAPDSDTIVPFIRHEFDFSEYPATVMVELLVSPSNRQDRDIGALVDELTKTNREAGSDQVEILLFRLRNAGLSDPDAAIQAIRSFEGIWWFDGANAEAGHSIIRELELVKRAAADALTVRRKQP